VNIDAADYHLIELNKLNIVLGKNGCGKSTLLKRVEQNLADATIGTKRYITPERGGILAYQANVEENHNSNGEWMSNVRRANQFNQFREQSVVQFRQLELSTYRLHEEREETASFQPYVDKLNALLDYVEIERRGASFVLKSKVTSEDIGAQNASSGESELVSLGIEILTFATEVTRGKENVLFLDEPDVHLHPDLQMRLMTFLRSAVDEGDFRVVLATHSTALLGGLADYEHASVAFMTAGEHTLTFEPVSEIRQRILPIFGAHPLSNVFNESPILLVEGDDDLRLWQQAVRTSHGAVSVFPVPCDTVSAMSDYEKDVKKITNAVYDDARAYSLRDRDGRDGELDDDPPLVRMRLACRAAENLFLSDEVLESCGIDWPEASRRIQLWLESNSSHPRHAEMQAFYEGGLDRKSWGLEDIRMILLGMVLNSNKPWEVLVGQAVGRLRRPTDGSSPNPDSLMAYLGEKTVRTLIPSS